MRIDLNKDRSVVLAQWGLFGEWWCYPVDITRDEIKPMLESIRDRLGSSFASCPLEYIEDRLFGGFSCADYPTRRHAHFATGQYSFLSAERGVFWALDDRDRQEQWGTLLEANEGHVIGDGPFMGGFPGEAN